MERHDELRDTDAPPALVAALADDERARHAYEALSPVQRSAYGRFVAEPRRDDVRERRARKAVDMLREGVKHP
jgi:uncharacterized protein YdeI (YjbR/CyaY-like superfamily)